MKEVEGKQVLFYKPTPLACADCHGNSIPVPNQKSSVAPRPAIPGASIKSGFHATEQHVKISETSFILSLPNSDHGSLRKISRALIYLRCLDPLNSRPCDSPGSQRTIKVSECPPAQGASEYLRQPGKVKRQLGSAEPVVSQRNG